MRRYLMAALCCMSLLAVTACASAGGVAPPQTPAPTAAPNASAAAPSTPPAATPVATAPALSARLLYLKPDAGEIWSMALDGSDQQRLLRVEQPDQLGSVVVSPDGRRLAYAARDEVTTVQFATTDGRMLPSVAIPPQANYHAITPWAFSPDGTKLALDRTLGTPEESAFGPFAALWTMTLASGDAHELASAAGASSYVNAPYWLDDRHLLYRDGKGNTMLIAAEGPATPELAAAGWIMLLAPDRTMMLVRDRFSFDDFDVQNLASHRLVALDGRQSGALREWSLPWGEFSWSPDGAQIAFFSLGYGKLQLLQRDSDTITDLRTFAIAQPDVAPTGSAEYLRPPIVWTPDGQGLLYLVETQSRVELRRFDVASRAEQVITPIDGHAMLLALQH